MEFGKLKAYSEWHTPSIGSILMLTKAISPFLQTVSLPGLSSQTHKPFEFILTYCHLWSPCGNYYSYMMIEALKNLWAESNFEGTDKATCSLIAGWVKHSGFLTLHHVSFISCSSWDKKGYHLYPVGLVSSPMHNTPKKCSVSIYGINE